MILTFVLVEYCKRRYFVLINVIIEFENAVNFVRFELAL